MLQATIGQLELKTEGRSVRVCVSGADRSASLDAGELRQLIDFARLALQDGANRRMAARLDIPEECELAVHLRIHDRRIPARPCDLSLTGLQLELPKDSQFRPLFIQETLQVELAYQGTRITLNARVVRQTGPTYGLHFPDCTRDGQLCPPQELQQLVERLEGGVGRSPA